MNQSNAKPKRPRPVTSDLILIVSVAVQVAPQGVVRVFCCPDHWPSISPPKTNIPACQLKPICPPAIPPFRPVDPTILVPLSSVGPSPNGVVVPLGSVG